MAVAERNVLDQEARDELAKFSQDLKTGDFELVPRLVFFPLQDGIQCKVSDRCSESEKSPKCHLLVTAGSLEALLQPLSQAVPDKLRIQLALTSPPWNVASI